MAASGICMKDAKKRTFQKPGGIIGARNYEVTDGVILRTLRSCKSLAGKYWSFGNVRRPTGSPSLQGCGAFSNRADCGSHCFQGLLEIDRKRSRLPPTGSRQASQPEESSARQPWSKIPKYIVRACVVSSIPSRRIPHECCLQRPSGVSA